MSDPKILTPPDMPHSVSERSSKNPSTKNISMNMLKDRDSAEDSDSDLIIAIYKIHSQLTDKITMDPFKCPSVLNLLDFSN